MYQSKADSKKLARLDPQIVADNVQMSKRYIIRSRPTRTCTYNLQIGMYIHTRYCTEYIHTRYCTYLHVRIIYTHTPYSIISDRRLMPSADRMAMAPCTSGKKDVKLGLQYNLV